MNEQLYMVVNAVYPRQNFKLANLLGVHSTTISKFISGIQEPTPMQKKKLATLLRKPEGKLFPSVEAKPVKQSKRRR